MKRSFLFLFLCIIYIITLSISALFFLNNYKLSYKLFGLISFYKINLNILLLSILISLFINVIIFKIISKKDSFEKIFYNTPFLIIPISFITLFIIKSAFQWADSIYFLFDSCYKNNLINPYRQLLSTEIMVFFRKILINIGINDISAYQIISCFSGAVSLFIIFKLFKKIFKNSENSFIAFIAFCSNYGIISIFSGHIESYSIYFLFYIIFINFCYLYIKKKISLNKLIFFYIILLLSHIQAIIILPVIIFLVINNNKITKLVNKLMYYLILIFIIINCFYNFPNVYNTIIYKYFFNLSNLFLLLFPISFFILICFKIKRTRFSKFLKLNIFFYIYGIILSQININTFYSDWDCFSAISIPIAILTSLTIVELKRKSNKFIFYSFFIFSYFFISINIIQNSGINSKYIPPGTAFIINKKNLINNAGVPAYLLKMGDISIKPLLNIVNNEKNVDPNIKKILISSCLNLNEECINILLKHNNIRESIYFLKKKPIISIKLSKKYLKELFNKLKTESQKGNSIKSLIILKKITELKYYINTKFNDNLQNNSLPSIKFSLLYNNRLNKIISELLYNNKTKKISIEKLTISKLISFNNINDKKISCSILKCFIKNKIFETLIEDIRNSICKLSHKFICKKYIKNRNAEQLYEIISEYKKIKNKKSKE